MVFSVSNIKYHRQILPAFRLVTFVTHRMFCRGTFLVCYDLDKGNKWVLRAFCVPVSEPHIFNLSFLIFTGQINLFTSFRWVNLHYTSESLKGPKQGQGWHWFSDPGQINSCGFVCLFFEFFYIIPGRILINILPVRSIYLTVFPN